MNKLLLLIGFIMFGVRAGYAQIGLPGVWKFHPGDSMIWSAIDYNDQNWGDIEIGNPWEVLDHADYNGFAWYRTKVIIPSKLKAQSYLKGSLILNLGKIDDGDQVFLNGKLIGQNAGQGGTIEEGPLLAVRKYAVQLDDPAIHWDGENVIAVRVFDGGGNGGIFEGPYSIYVADITDSIEIDHRSEDSHFKDNRHFDKTISLKTTSKEKNFSGVLTIEIRDNLNGKLLKRIRQNAAFSFKKPFVYHYAVALPADRSCQAYYHFLEARSNRTVTSTEGIPYILTPVATSSPKINGPRITGVRPGHPFFYRIPVTGERPRRFELRNLPQGLHFDEKSGIISGRLSRPGTYSVSLKVSNQFGKDTASLSIRVGEEIGLTPAMGWNSWNVWGLSVNDEKVRAAADAMEEAGLLDHGWTYLNIDDGWQAEARAGDGEIIPNDKFPDMKGLTDYVHSKGLRMGIYSSPGSRTCGGFLGSYGHEAQDARTYEAWGIDYLKYDWCSYWDVAPHPNLKEMQRPFKLMDSALRRLDRDIYFSLCQYGMGQVWKWGAEAGGNSWRITGDIRDTWASMLGIALNIDKCAPYGGPGNWNDPDMLVVGKVGWGPTLSNTQLSFDEQYTHISLWCLFSAPLLIGCDISQMDPFTANLLTNDEVLAIDQDPLGKTARLIQQTDSILVFKKPLADGSWAVGIVNKRSSTTEYTLPVSTLFDGGTYKFRDLWRQKGLGVFSGQFPTGPIPSHGILLLKLSLKS